VAAGGWLAGAESGEIRSRSGHPYKPSTLRGYRQALEERVLPVIGGAKLAGITTADPQALVDRWQAERTPAFTIRNTVKPLQAIYRRPKSRGGLPLNPTRDLELPAPRPAEIEIVAPEVASRLLAALPDRDRLVWAFALYAGLRYGELRALRWGAVDAAGGKIAVRESWDPKDGPIVPKTRTSRRTVSMPGVLRDLVLEHRLADDHHDDELIFGPFHATALYRRADATWEAAGLGSGCGCTRLGTPTRAS
jgi:integrase